MFKKIIHIGISLSFTFAFVTCSKKSSDSSPLGGPDSFVGSEIKLSTIGYNALQAKIKTHLQLTNTHPSLIFLQDNKEIWTGQKEISEAKYRLLVDLADLACSETDIAAVQLTNPQDVSALFEKMTGYAIQDEFQNALNTQLNRSELSSTVLKQEFACMAIILDPRTWATL